MSAVQENASPKSGLTTFLLCMFLGSFGIHRFYVGKIGTGILMLITLGGLGFWALYDLLSIVCKNFTDKQGRLVEVDKSPDAPRNVVLVFAIFCVIIFGLTTVIVGKAISGISTVGKSELTALRQGDLNQAYSYTSSDFQKGVNFDTFRKFVDTFPQLHDNIDSTFTNVDYKDNAGIISGIITMKDGTTVPIQMGVVKENDQWKVNDINIDKSAKTINPPESAAPATQTTKPESAKPAANPQTKD